MRECLGHPDILVPRAKDGTLEVWDLFAGAGGFTTGAKLAGCTVAYACDAWPEALETYRRNHPETHTQCLQLPAPIPFPTDGRPFHIHGSPPCQRFTDQGRRHNTDSSLEIASNLIEWFIETALSCGATSWSMEQVSRSESIAIVEAARLRHPTRVAYTTVDFYDLGVPQHRKRLIAGSPTLVAHLTRTCSEHRHRSVNDVIIHPHATMIRSNLTATHKRLRHDRQNGESKYVYTAATADDCLHPLTGPAPTVVTNGDVRWWWTQPSGKSTWTRLSVREIALLQTFPADYKWPSIIVLGRQLIGNAVPPLVAQLLLKQRTPTVTDEPNKPPATHRRVSTKRPRNTDAC